LTASSQPEGVLSETVTALSSVWFGFDTGTIGADPSTDGCEKYSETAAVFLPVLFFVGLEVVTEPVGFVILPFFSLGWDSALSFFALGFLTLGAVALA